jgi:hypothetical protein
MEDQYTVFLVGFLLGLLAGIIMCVPRSLFKRGE